MSEIETPESSTPETSAPETSAPTTPAPETPAPVDAPEAPAKVAEAPTAPTLKDLRAGKLPPTASVKETTPPVVPPAATPPPAPFTPNLKVRVMDKDYAIDPIFKDVIKDKETQKKVQELYEKSLGLDFVKPKYAEAQSQLAQINQGAQNLQKMVAENRLEEFFAFWKVPKNALYEHVKAQLQYEDLPADEKAKVDRQRSLENEARQAQFERSQILRQHEDLQVHHRQRELDTVISRPDVSQIAEEFDTRVGRPGAFRMEVINRGKVAAITAGKDLSAEEALDEVMTSLGYVAVDAQAEPPVAQAAPIVAPVVQKKLPVLPNLGAGGASPVKKVIQSTKELRALYKQNQGS